MKLNRKEYTKGEITKRIGNIQQLGGTIHYEFSSGRAKGVSVIEFHTGSGFRFTVIPDRGLDIAFASFRGTNLVYITPNGIVNPAFYEPEGYGWLRTFFGGLLTTCGLTYFGHPGRDNDEELGLHGRYSTIPADGVCDLSRWEGDEYILEVKGTVEECVLFGDKIRLTRSISTRIGEKSLLIKDRVENYGYKTSPLTILYHVNAGFPLLDNSSKLVLTSTKVEPYTDVARAGLGELLRFSEPIHGFEGQDFLHSMAGDDDGYALAGLINRELGDGLGLYLRFHTSTLPFLNEWKMLGEGDYVLGIEPVNTKILSRGELRKEGRLPFIEPGEVKEMEVEIGVLDGNTEIEEFTGKVNRIVKG
jgi:hypothetical protein